MMTDFFIGLIFILFIGLYIWAYQTYIVDVNGEFKVVEVKEVDPRCQIDTSDAITYKWIVDKVDFSYYESIKEKQYKVYAELLEAVKQKQITEAIGARGLTVEGLKTRAGL